tara:strand:- start:78 stop:476 length:399 start_codon:yes stop_codon:yes gene_type:complete
MKKILMIVIFGLLFKTNAYSEWLLFTDIKQNGMKVFIDLETFKKDKNFRYIWMLSDLKSPLRDNTIDFDVYSSKEYVKIDCQTMKTGKLQYIFYSGQMGEGKHFPFQRENIKWIYYPPKSWAHNLAKLLCEY